MVYVWDRRGNKLVGKYPGKEDAVKAVGGIITLFGERFAKGRFVATREPTKHQTAEMVYDSRELFQRALIYVDKSVYERARTHHK